MDNKSINNNKSIDKIFKYAEIHDKICKIFSEDEDLYNLCQQKYKILIANIVFK